MRSVGAIPVWTVTAIWVAAAQTPGELVPRHLPGDQFSVSVPADWVEVPRAELEQMTAKAREAFPKARPQPYDYGFQAPGKSGYPRAIVQIKRTGRWSEELLAKMAGIEAQKGKIERNVKSAGPGAAALHLEVGQVHWDAAAHIAWMRIEFASPDGERVVGLSGVHPTEYGSIQVNCYAPGAEFDRWAPEFASIVSSVRMDPGAQYRMKSAAARIRESVAWPALAGMAVAGAVIFSALAQRRERSAASRKAHVVSASWKLPLGGLLLYGLSEMLRKALAGDGWLQSSNEAKGYWAVWGALICVSLLLIHLGSRDILALRRGRSA